MRHRGCYGIGGRVFEHRAPQIPFLDAFLSVERRESWSRGHASPRQGKVRSWEMERRTWRPRARRVARLARFQCGGRLTLPHPRPLPKGRSRSRPRFCTWGRQPPRPKSGRLAHLAQVDDCKSDIGDCDGQVDYVGECMARGSQSAVAKALQPFSFQGTPGAHLLPGGAQPCGDRGM